MGLLLDGLITWSIRQRVLVLIGAVVLVVLGIWSATHARTDVLPEFTPPRVVLQTEAPGMSTPDVEDLITRPLERVLLGTPESTVVRSTSSPGLSVSRMPFTRSRRVARVRSARVAPGRSRCDPATSHRGCLRGDAPRRRPPHDFRVGPRCDRPRRAGARSPASACVSARTTPLPPRATASAYCRLW